MADFSGLASVMTVPKEELTYKSNKPTTQQKTKSLELSQSTNSKVSLKLLQILKDHQDELIIEEEQQILQQQQQQIQPGNSPAMPQQQAHPPTNMNSLYKSMNNFNSYDHFKVVRKISFIPFHSIPI